MKQKHWLTLFWCAWAAGNSERKVETALSGSDSERPIVNVP